MGDWLEDMIHDLGQESFEQAHAPMYDTLESDSKKPLYPGCKKSLILLFLECASGNEGIVDDNFF